MPHLEPTYLRYIYDGLMKGTIHPENAAELPEGLIGLYEEAFDERTSVVERQKLLQRFAVWALFKKEVSAAFVSEILGETEDDIQEFISTYSAWLNSPESGKYQLYHERLKVYLLQKLSEKEIHELHERLILRLEKAIKEQKTDELEWYGLEFLTGHYAVNAMLNGDGSKLLAIAYDQNHWQRQLKFSKGYAWTKNALKEVMTWASKYNDDEVIECGLQMVDLHHQEQNAAPQIVALFAEGDIDSALKRIEQFGDNDKEGLQRKFILYMLCLMELTLLDSKDKPFRKEGIEKLLKHLDEQLPVDHSLLNWSEFYSSYHVLNIVDQLIIFDIDACFLFQYSSKWELEQIKKYEATKSINYQFLLRICSYITDEYWRIIRIIELSTLVFEETYDLTSSKEIMSKATELVRSYEGGLKHKLVKSLCLNYLNQNEIFDAIQSLELYRDELSDEKLVCFIQIFKKIQEQKISIEFYSIEELFEFMNKIPNDYEKSLLIVELVKVLSILGNYEKAKYYALKITDNPRVRITALNHILLDSNKNEDPPSIDEMKKLISVEIKKIEEDWELDIVYSESIDMYIQLMNFKESIQLVDKIKDDYWKNESILKILQSSNLSFGKNDVELTLLQKLDGFAEEKIDAISSLALKYFELNEIQTSTKMINDAWKESYQIESEFGMNQAQLKLCECIFKVQPTLLSNYLLDQISSNVNRQNRKKKVSILLEFIENLGLKKQEQSIDPLVEEVLVFISTPSFIDSYEKSIIRLVKTGWSDRIIQLAMSLENAERKSEIIRICLNEQKEYTHKVESWIDELIKSTAIISSFYWRIRGNIELLPIFNKYSNKKKIHEYILIILHLNQEMKEWYFIEIKVLLAAKLYELGMYSESNKIWNECINEIQLYNDDNLIKAKLALALGYSSIGKMSECYKILSEIESQNDKDISLSLNSKSEAIFKIVSKQIDSENIVDVSALIEQISNKRWSDRSNNKLLHYYLKRDLLNEAFATSDKFYSKEILRNAWMLFGGRITLEILQKTLGKIKKSSQDAQYENFLINGFIKGKTINDISNDAYRKLIFQNQFNPENLEILLTNYFTKQIFYGSAINERKQPIKLLDLKWAIDIKNQISKF